MASRLRISGGSARGLPIVEPRGVRLRPTSGLVREAIFNIIAERVPEARVLDLFAGTGALGIESLSRGAASATFVEGEAACCQAIAQTLNRAGLESRARVLRGRMPAALASLEGPYDLILMDPPYNLDEATTGIAEVARLLAGGGMVVFEHASRYNPPEHPRGLHLTDRRVYGDTAIALYTGEED
ncbi:MAG: 16S rRNA (guanine(966)-N(2))-methyltransferase RsmD [Dehalococcoidia bacterium]